MILLHCPPTPVYQRDDIFGELERQKKAAQVAANVKAAELPPLTDAHMQAVTEIYDRYLREIIHPQW